jgi:predicted RNase H-like HicB family nuclease
MRSGVYKYSYLAVVERYRESRFTARTPEFPGLIAVGGGEQEVVGIVRNVLAQYIRGRAQKGERLLSTKWPWESDNSDASKFFSRHVVEVDLPIELAWTDQQSSLG